MWMVPPNISPGLPCSRSSGWMSPGCLLLIPRQHGEGTHFLGGGWSASPPSGQIPDSSLAEGRRYSTTFSTPPRARSAPPEASRPARVLAAYSAVSLATPQASSQLARAAPRTLSEVLARGTLMLFLALRRRVEMVSFSSEAIWGKRGAGSGLWVWWP